MKIVIPIILLQLCAAFGYAQQRAAVAGNIKNTLNEPVAGATVQLQNASDSAVVTTHTSNENGVFRFENILHGTYRLYVSTGGYRPFAGQVFTIDSLHNFVTLPPIIVQFNKKTELAEVVVTARRPLIVQDLDKTIVNVESMMSSATSNTLEILEKTPGVIVSANGEISLNGRSGVLVLIDGRPTYMSGQDLAAYLKSIPGGTLDRIELIDNPSAKYDAAGNAIINIRLKKNRAGGFTGSLSVGYTQGRYARINDALNLNYRYKKINLFGNIGYGYEKTYNTDTYDRHFFNALNEEVSSIYLVTQQGAKGKGLNGFWGADYSLSANTTIGFVVNMNEYKRNGLLQYAGSNYSNNIQPDSTSNGYTASTDKRHNLGTNINFNHRFGNNGRELSADFNYLRYTGGGDQSIRNFVYGNTGDPLQTSSFLYTLPSTISIYTAKADYVHPLSKDARIEAGFKSGVVNNDNLANYFNTSMGTPVVDNSQTNHFLYRENINAGYINAQAKWSRIGVQLGLRAENTQATGRQLGNDSVKESRFTKNYTQLFPSMFISYKLDSAGRNTLTASITRRINRPNYQLLNPFLFMRDQYTYTGGNPLLGPQYQYRYELRYQYKQILRMGLSYNRFTDVIFQTTDVVDKIFITKPENIAKGFMLLLNTGITLNPAKWWTFNSDILLSHIGLDGNSYGQKLDPNAYIARINVINMFQFKNGWAAEAGAYYASKDLNGQAYTSGMIRTNAGVQKKLWKDKVSIRLSVEDIFHSWIYHYTSVGLKQAQFFQTGGSDTQRIGIGFTWRFGKNNFARKSRHNDNANDEEKGRVN